MTQDDRPTTILPVLPLDDAVVLPGTSVTFPVATAGAGRGARRRRGRAHRARAARRGPLRVLRRRRGRRWARSTLPDGTRGVAVEAVHRAELGPAAGADAGLRVSVRELPDPDDPGPEAAAAGARVPRRRRGGRRPARRPAPAWPTSSRRSPTPAGWPTRPGTRPRSRSAAKLELLETTDVVERLRLAIAAQRERLADAGLRRRIREDVAEGLDQTQREMLLRRQLAAIRKELGEGEDGGRRRLGDAHRRGRHARGRADGGRARARPPRAPARGPRGRDDPHLPRVDGLAAVGQPLRGAPGRGRRPRGARRRPRRPRRGQGAHPGVPGRPPPAPRARDGRRPQRRDPDAGRAARARARPRSAGRSRAPWAASSPASAWAASATRPRSAATGAPTSARCRGGWCAPCARPGP